MIRLTLRATGRRAVLGLRSAACAGLIGLVGACTGTLLPKPAAPPTLYSLDDVAAPAATRALPPRPGAPTLVVTVPRAAAGFDTPRIVYLREKHRIESFASNQWVDTPAQMLMPLIVHALQHDGAFAAVLGAPTAAAGDRRLDTELVRLQQEFSERPSRVRLTLRAVLIDSATRRVVAWREFEASVAAPSDDPYGGVVAANQAVRQVLDELAAFCSRTATR